MRGVYARPANNQRTSEDENAEPGPRAVSCPSPTTYEPTLVKIIDARGAYRTKHMALFAAIYRRRQGSFTRLLHRYANSMANRWITHF